MKDYKVISARSLEGLVAELKEFSHEGWVIQAYTQEFGVTKILLERDSVAQEKEV